MIVLIDNYDSFVHTLARYLGELGLEQRVIRNDAVSLAELEHLNPSALLLSPGPSTPEKAGICVELIRQFRGRLPILGICLGHQAIAVAYGGTVDRAPTPRHGMADDIVHDGTHPLFAGLPSPFKAARYHSLAVTHMPPQLTALAHSPDGVNMALAAAGHVYGLQFHPESILSQHGHQMLANFLSISGIKNTLPPPLAPLADGVQL